MPLPPPPTRPATLPAAPTQQLEVSREAPVVDAVAASPEVVAAIAATPAAAPPSSTPRGRKRGSSQDAVLLKTASKKAEPAPVPVATATTDAPVAAPELPAPVPATAKRNNRRTKTATPAATPAVTPAAAPAAPPSVTPPVAAKAPVAATPAATPAAASKAKPAATPARSQSKDTAPAKARDDLAAPTVVASPPPAVPASRIPVPPPPLTQSLVGAVHRRRGTRGEERQCLFVLDTNVLMHDPSALFRFQEHDIFLPMITLEELDHNKKGTSEVARNARQVSRTLDELIRNTTDIAHGVALSNLGHKDARGRLLIQTEAIATALPLALPPGKADNQILGVVQALRSLRADRDVVLVSKDINMRLKARALGLAAEDYFNDQVLEDADLLYTGIQALPDDFWQRHSEGMESWQQNGLTFYRIRGPLCAQWQVNQFIFTEHGTPLYAQVISVNGDSAVLRTLRDHTHAKHNVWGVSARNREQNFALNLLMDPECDFVTLLGQAGTGKTLLTLAAGLTQVLESKLYSEIIMTRVTVPVGEDIGFLPGTEEEKMQPWMGALDDNLEVLNKGEGDTAGEWGRAATLDLIRSRVKVKSLNFMRGRTFLNKFLILDEAQNLTPKQMKTLITRAGPGTKVVCLGNIAQIDTPYLTEGSSGLTYVVDRFKGWQHAGHITLQRGERSRLADYAADVL